MNVPVLEIKVRGGRGGEGYREGVRGVGVGKVTSSVVNAPVLEIKVRGLGRHGGTWREGQNGSER